MIPRASPTSHGLAAGQHTMELRLVDKSPFGAHVDDDRFERGFVLVEVLLVVFEPVLHGNDAAVLIAKATNESVNRHPGQRDDAGVRRKLRIDR